MPNRPDRRVAILQSNYIPWKGYFDIIRRCDAFVFLDEVQSTKNDWRNRNRIKTAQGESWLTIPVHHALDLRIQDVAVADSRWARKHLRSLEQAYARAPHMADLREWLTGLYEQAATHSKLVDINRIFIAAIVEKLDIPTPLSRAGDIMPIETIDELNPTARLVRLCELLGATSYLSGPAARDYLDVALFSEAGIAVEWADYEGFPVYPQLHGEFRHDVSALDLLLMTGPDAPRYLVRPDASMPVSR